MLQLQLHYTTLQLQLPTTTPQHATTTTTLHQLHLITLIANYNSTAQQLQLQRTTLHPAVVGEVTTPATTCNHSKKHNFKHLSVHQWIRSAVRGSQQPTSYRFPIFETSATALCGTTGIIYLSI